MQVILAREPDNFRALFRLLLLLWRSASMELAEEFLDAARRATPRSAMQAGYHACMGLHQRCCNKPQVRRLLH